MQSLIEAAQIRREEIAKGLSTQIKGVGSNVITVNNNVVAGNKMIADLTAKVDIIMAQMQAESVKATATQPQTTVVKCDKCGYEIKNKAVVDYCKNRKLDGVYCTKCQQALGLTGSKFKAKEKPADKPVQKGIKTTCSICKGVIFFDDKEAMGNAYNRAIEAGLPGIAHRGCAKKYLAEQEAVISVPSVDAKVADTKLEAEYAGQQTAEQFEAEARKDKADAAKSTLDNVAGIVTFLLGKGMTGDEIKALPIADVRKLLMGYGTEVNLHGNVWNVSKGNVIDSLCKPQEEEQKASEGQFRAYEESDEEVEEEACF